MAAYHEFYNYLTKFQDFLRNGKNAELVFECHEGHACVHLHHALGHLPRYRYLPQQNHANQELHSFLKKFLTLLQSGKNAHLVFASHDGQARVSLHHALGHLPQQYPHQNSYDRQQYQQPNPSPSRLRRRVRRAMARSAATAAKETSVTDDTDLEDTSNHVTNTAQAESTNTDISSVDAVIADDTFPTKPKDPDPPVQHCPSPTAELTKHQPQLENGPLQPDEPICEKLADSVPPGLSRPDCPCFDVDESLSQEQRRAPLSEVPRLIALRVMRKAAGLPPECACDG